MDRQGLPHVEVDRSMVLAKEARRQVVGVDGARRQRERQKRTNICEDRKGQVTWGGSLALKYCEVYPANPYRIMDGLRSSKNPHIPSV